MRQWMTPIIGAVALSLAIPASANARPRFGPAALLGAFAAPLGAMLGGLRPAIGQRSNRHSQRASTAASTSARRTASKARASRAEARASRAEARTSRAEAQVERPAVAKRVASREPPLVAGRVDQPAARLVSWTGPVFWPYASDDMFDYAFFPSAADNRFWAYDHGHIFDGVFAASARSGGAADQRVAAAFATVEAATELCGSTQAAGSADRVVARIDELLAPEPAQRRALDELRTALVEAADRIRAACRTAVPSTPPERLDAMQDRIWAMRDAVLTIRIPLENFYGALSNDQKARLNGSDPSLGGIEADATDGLASTVPRSCGDSASALGDWPMRTIERVLRPSEQQRASLQALQMQFFGMTRLIMSSCPAPASADPLGRLAAAMDRLDVMLFAIMSMGPSLQAFYDSLSDQQKADLHRAFSRHRRAGGES